MILRSQLLLVLQLYFPNHLEYINVNSNRLCDFKYNYLNPITLKKLCLSNNNLSENNISIFSHLINLRILSIGKFDSHDRKKQINKFCGSLESLKNLTRLKDLDVKNININQGLEY